MGTLKKKFPQFSEIPKEGYYDQGSYYWYIQKKANWKVDMQRSFLHFGNAGCDGIEFGLGENMNGVWAYYPLNNEFIKKVETVDEFIAGWISGEINV